MVAKLKVVEMVESGRLAWVADSLYMYVIDNIYILSYVVRVEPLLRLYFFILIYI
jgi:hypothetical protein